ncbi:uncharacterized protein LOC133844726 isoform X1 [Drosophila sulfurigaster albostrigata]|uniref:uncharacterized protein LOC133844726 isoform X1 n=1 Tax=Drosophila sulfurigaster albostrigata TaxID=89887 RepID=UPI002D21DE0C|nr:uncharacterized protein LOC133844726 isoform X1 [Drosophila sulfurigaster albostrigata]
MEEVEPESMAVTAEAEQISVPEMPSLQIDTGINDVEQTEATVEGEAVAPTGEGEDVVSTTDAQTDREKRLLRREEKRKARAILDRHYAKTEETVTPATSQQTTRSQTDEDEGDGDAKDDNDSAGTAKDEGDGEGGEGVEPSLSVEETKQLSRLESTLILESDDLRTGASSSEEDDDYMRGPQGVSFKDDFLQYFYMPSMSDLSTESEEHVESSILSRPGSAVEDEQVDKGKFVNPLTGLTESSSKSVEEVPAKEEIVEVTSSSSTSSEFEWPFDDDEEEFKPQPMIPDAEDVALEMFLDVHTPLSKSREQSTTAMEALRVIRETRQIAIEFIHKIIDQVVDTAEYVDPIKELVAKLNKSKLMAHLQKLYGQFLVAKQFNVDVNNKMYDYYRRVGQTRCFDSLPAKVEQVEHKRYMDALKLLDHLKKKTEETKRTNSEVLASVKMDMDFVSNIALSSVEALENRMREVLIHKDAQILPRIVENELRRMQQMRNEVSDSRLWLITRQHTLGRLVERKRKFDQITEELTMDTYLMAQRDVTALGTKVEERNYDLNRMRDRCTKHMHQLAFIREKTSLSIATLLRKSVELNEKLKKREGLRDVLLKLKLKRARLKSQQSDLHEKCGILHKPALLYDFDATVEFIETKRESVAKLKQTMQDLETRIAALECN